MRNSSGEKQSGLARREVSCRVIRSILQYLESHGHEVGPVLEGLPFSREYLSNPVNWISYEYRNLICQRTAEVIGNPRIMYEVGLAAPELNSLGGLESVVRLLSGPTSAYRLVNRYSGFFDKGFSLITHFKGNNRMTVTMRAIKPYAVSSHSCYYAQGVLAAVPVLWNLPPAEVVETACAYKSLDGGRTPVSEACVFEVKWKTLPQWHKKLIDSLFFIPSARPFALRELENDLLQTDAENTELRLRNAQLSTIRELSLALENVRSRDQVYQTVLETARNIPGVRFVVFLTLDESGRNVIVPYFSSIRNKAVIVAMRKMGFDLFKFLGEEPARGRLSFPRDNSPLVLEYMANPRVVTRQSLPEVLEGICPRPIAEMIQKTAGVQQVTTIPVFVDGEAWGAITFFLSEDVPQDILQMVGAHCAIAVKNTRVLEKLQKRNKQLRESEEYLRAMLEAIHTGVVIIDAETHIITDINAYACELIGETRENIIGKLCHRFICPAEVGQCPITELNQSINLSERTLLTANGQTRPIYKNAVLVRRGGRSYIVESFSDIGPLKRAQSALEESERRYRRLSDNAPDLISRLEMEPLRFSYVSPSVEGLTGHTPAEVYAMDPCEFVHPEDLKVITHPPGRDSWQMNIRLKNKKGKYITLEQRNVPLFDGNQRLEAVESISRDITDRLRAQKELFASEQRYRTIFNSTNDILMLIDSEGRIIDVNQKIRAFGYEPEMLIGQPVGTPSSMLSPENAALIVEQFNKRIANQPVPPYEVVMIKQDGSRAVVEINASLIVEGGRIVGDLAVVRDITERKAAEKQIRSLYEQEKAQRMELEEEGKARAMFIDILAHELRTPLTPMLITTGILNDLLASQPEEIYRKLSGTLSTSAANLAERLEELLEMARYARGTFTLNKKTINLREFIEAVVSREQARFDRNRQTLEVNNAGIPESAVFDALRLEQVINNLLSNAGKFSPPGSKVEFNVSVEDNFLRFEVKDEGTGISIEDQKRLFQPYHRFQQDRSVYPGTGLGLAVCKQIIEAHGGRIWYRSEPGKGSTFGFDIPLA